MDSFQPCARLMLKELHVLLQLTPTVFASTRLVQLMALNMFSIHNLRTRGECWFERLILLIVRPAGRARFMQRVVA